MRISMIDRALHHVRSVWGRVPRWRRGALVAGGLLVVAPSTPWAHEIPRRVAVQAFVVNSGTVVRVLVRVPLDAMRDVEFPIRGAGYLDVARADSTLRDAARIWVADAIDLVANDVTLPTGRLAAVRASLPSDHAFERYADALALVRGVPLDGAIDIPVPQAMLDVLLEYPATEPDARLAIRARFAHLGVRTSTALRAVFADGTERAYVYEGDAGLLPLDPSWWHAATRFVVMGATHLLDGIDHLLFLLCLILPVRRIRPLVGIVTAFTVAHSMTLAASALGYAPDALWFPPLVELLIAASIVYMAIENIVGAKLERRWLVAFGFGLVHGFGFSYALRESLQFAGAHLVTALAAFNVGIELGQLAVLMVAVPLLSWLFTRRVAEGPWRIVISVLVAHTAWHWMTSRFETLRTYHLSWPAMDVALAITLIRLAMGLLVVGGTAWALSGFMSRWTAVRPRGSALLLALCAGTMLAVTMLPSVGAAQDSVRTTMTGVYTVEQATKGKEVFNGACVGCHTSASHSGEEFAKRWVGKMLWEFYDYVSRLMPDEAPGALSEGEYLSVTAYVLKLNGMPAGSSELKAVPEDLKSIRIDTVPNGVNQRSSGGSRHGARIR
ncbi:MAG: HupE/UreJ family protein [Gemmatimonadaceae bacterium]|nr:HupE/UreJ family protein [Gemmatimonadaceae bacterium]